MLLSFRNLELLSTQHISVGEIHTYIHTSPGFTLLWSFCPSLWTPSIWMFYLLPWVDLTNMDHLRLDVLALYISGTPSSSSMIWLSHVSFVFSLESISFFFVCFDIFYTIWIEVWVFQYLKITFGHWHTGKTFPQTMHASLNSDPSG